AVNVTRLYAFYRDTGVVEFVTDLSRPTIAGFGGAPIIGPVADETGLYLVVAAGAGGGTRVSVLNLPAPVPLPPSGGQQELGRGAKRANPVDVLANRYPLEGAARSSLADTFEPSPESGVDRRPARAGLRT